MFIYGNVIKLKDRDSYIYINNRARRNQHANTCSKSSMKAQDEYAENLAVFVQR